MWALLKSTQVLSADILFAQITSQAYLNKS